MGCSLYIDIYKASLGHETSGCERRSGFRCYRDFSHQFVGYGSLSVYVNLRDLHLSALPSVYYNA
jgi:hypothetical protein